jgi:GT2 family glycosyltransferase
METEPELSIIVLSWNTRDLLEKCLRALQSTLRSFSYEVIVIDNASSDGSADFVARMFPEVRLHRNDSNLGYAIGVNQGLARSRGRYLCLLGSDTEVQDGALAGLVQFLKDHPQVGAVAPPLFSFDGTRQRACMRFPSMLTVLTWDTPVMHFFPNNRELKRYQMKDWDHVGTRAVDQPPGTCFLLRRSVYESVGPMDERLWLFFNDVDWCRRMARAEIPIWYVDGPGVFHHEGGSTRHFAAFAIEWHRNRIAYYRKHFGVLGSLLTKSVMSYVAVRQCFRMLKDLPAGREWLGQCRQILGFAWRLLHS